MERKKGFYWVILKSEYMVAEYVGTGWFIIGLDWEYADENFDKIADDPLLPPDLN